MQRRRAARPSPKPKSRRELRVDRMILRFDRINTEIDGGMYEVDQARRMGDLGPKLDNEVAMDFPHVELTKARRALQELIVILRKSRE